MHFFLIFVFFFHNDHVFGFIRVCVWVCKCVCVTFSLICVVFEDVCMIVK